MCRSDVAGAGCQVAVSLPPGHRLPGGLTYPLLCPVVLPYRPGRLTNLSALSTPSTFQINISMIIFRYSRWAVVEAVSSLILYSPHYRLRCQGPPISQSNSKHLSCRGPAGKVVPTKQFTSRLNCARYGGCSHDFLEFYEGDGLGGIKLKALYCGNSSVLQ